MKKQKITLDGITTMAEVRTGKKNPMCARAKKYLNGGGGACLFCGSWDVEGSSWDMNGEQVSQDVTCLKCDKSWTDFYTLDCVAYRDAADKYHEYDKEGNQTA